MHLALILMACLRQNLQWINVEEALAIQCHTAQYCIVQGLLQHISIMTVSLYLQHSPCKESQTDCSTSLRISCVIWQIKRERKCLSHMSRTNTTCYIHLISGNTLPQTLTCRIHLFIIGQSRYICHAGIEIYSTNRMSKSLIL